MSGQISVGSFLALCAIMAAGIRFPRFTSPALGVGLVVLSGVAVVSGLAHIL